MGTLEVLPIVPSSFCWVFSSIRASQKAKAGHAPGAPARSVRGSRTHRHELHLVVVPNGLGSGLPAAKLKASQVYSFFKHGIKTLLFFNWQQMPHAGHLNF